MKYDMIRYKIKFQHAVLSVTFELHIYGILSSHEETVCHARGIAVNVN